MDYTTIENQFDTFDKDYQLYILNIILEYLTAYGKNQISREELRQVIDRIKNELAIQKMPKPIPKVRKLILSAAMM